MNGQVCDCGCVTQPCGCCEGVQQLTPASEYNRPGLPALSYRVGTHARFFETMKARLSTMRVDGVGADGQTVETFQPLQGLTTRDPDDFSIALLDGWSTLGDVLTFYQERIANEGFLRTATERRSILELSRLVGYTLRPGVAATVYLAYTIDDNQTNAVTIPAGAASQSIPGPGQTPQIFETSEDLIARTAWNDLQVRLTQPANITQSTALTVDTVYVAGTATNLKKGDKLLLVFAKDGTESVLRTVDSIDTQFADQRTAITLQAIDPFLAACVPLLMACLAGLPSTVDTSRPEGRSMSAAEALLEETLLALVSDPTTWFHTIEDAADGTLPQPYSDAFNQLDTNIKNLAAASGVPVPTTTTPAAFVTRLLLGMVPQVANSLQLKRSLGQSFLPGADTSPQLLVQLAPILRDTYYQAWAGANLNSAQAPLVGLYAFRAGAALFGAGASKLAGYYGTNTSGIPPGTLKPQDQWTEWNYQTDETSKNAFLDQSNDAVVPGSYVLTINPNVSGGFPQRQVLQVQDAASSPRTAYGLSGKTTMLSFNHDWRDTGSGATMNLIDDLRTTQVYAQSEPLTLLETPIADPVTTQQIELDGLYRELTSGRWVILSGERADIDNVAGVTVSELQMISGLNHGFDPNLAGDRIHTTLQLSTPLAYQYKRDTLTIYGNVAKATHGSTIDELLGSGDGAQSLQSFTLKQPPLTFVAAPTAAGADSTLHAYVNNVEWHETQSLAWLGPKDRGFVTLTDDAGNTALTFGDGSNGARLPTGVQNVTSVYRSGIGAAGNVNAGQISMLQTRPLSVKSVINPLRASGGADKESRDLARENAPLSVMPLDRLVSIRDYQDFTRRFAGIAKALALRTSDGLRQLLYLTIAGVDDAPIDVTSDLYKNLLDALYQLGDPDLPIRVDLRELRVLVLSAKIKLLPDYLWEPVASAVRAQLYDAFGFDRRTLGQWALMSEVISAIQNVTGVAYVDVGAFGSIPEKTTDNNGARRLLTQDEISAQVQNVVNRSGSGPFHGFVNPDRLPASICAWGGGPDKGILRPAELVVFMPAVADTLILNQIL
jgi:predicted phage baseplate assembly protein